MNEPSETPPPQSDTAALPRILCLHGGGTNATIFRIQCRVIAQHLAAAFRLVYVDAPFLSAEPGPDVAAVFGSCGPFRRWLRFGSAATTNNNNNDSSSDLTEAETVERLDGAIGEAVAADAGTGEWVALMGFSQGAKMAASWLYRQQCRDEDGAAASGRVPRFRFGVLVAGRGPLVSLEPGRARNRSLPDVTEMSTAPDKGTKEEGGEHVLRVPTVHVHGLQDPGIALHRRLYEECCDPATRSLLVWDGGHRLPIRSGDVAPLVKEIFRLAAETEGGGGKEKGVVGRQAGQTMNGAVSQ